MTSSDSKPFSDPLRRGEADRVLGPGPVLVNETDIRWSLERGGRQCYGAGDVAVTLPPGEGFELFVKPITFDYQIEPEQTYSITATEMESLEFGPGGDDGVRFVGVATGYARDAVSVEDTVGVSEGIDGYEAKRMLGHGQGADLWGDDV